MKLNLIVTGQVRNEATFELLVKLVAERRELFGSVVFASWSDQLALAGTICGKVGFPDLFEIVDCGNAYFGPTIGNRDISSFLAQHQQIARALGAIDTDCHLMRLRADFDPVGAEEFYSFIELVEAIWTHPLGHASSLVFGANDSAPYFFEDRILLLAPQHVAKVKAIDLAGLYEFDYFNLYPEFLFYSSVIEGDRDFILHDHRYSRRAGFGDDFSDYDYATFGPEFPRFAERYLGSVSDAVLFVRDGVALTGREDLWERLINANFVPTNFRIRDMREYRRTWMSRSDAYEISFGQRESARWTPADRSAIQAEKVVFNALFVMYFSGNSAGVIDTRAEGSVFDQAIRDLKGASLIVRGERDRGLEVLNALLDEGYMGFEQGFYLCRQLAVDRNAQRYAVARAAFLEKFQDLPRAMDHIAEMDALLASPLPGKKGKKRQPAAA